MNLETMRLANWMHMCINTFRHINHRLDREKMKTNTHTHSNTSNNINQLTKSNIYSWAELYRAAIKKKTRTDCLCFPVGGSESKQ